jgi:hypothetical protein
MKKIKISKALKETWDLKEKAYKEVEKLILKDAIKNRINKSLETAKSLGFLSEKPGNDRRTV